MRARPTSLPAAAYLRLALVAGGLGFSCCIERSNPFDPLNSNPQQGSEIRSRNQSGLDSLTQGETGITGFLRELALKMQGDSLVNAGILADGGAKRAANARARSANSDTEAFNRNNPSAGNRRQASLALLDTLQAYGPYPGLEANRSLLEIRLSRISEFFSRINSESAPVAVYTGHFTDSILAPFRNDSLTLARIGSMLAADNAGVAARNREIRAYNDTVASANAAVYAYNLSIDFLFRSRGRTVILRSDSLQANTFVAKPGDSLYLGRGVFDVDLRFTNSGTADSPIVVRGYPGMGTILRAVEKNGVLVGSALALSGRAHIRFEDLVFRKGLEAGVKLVNGTRAVAFRRCRFDSSGKWGIEAVDSDLDLEDCLVIENGGGAHFTGSPNADSRIRLLNVLIARNGGNGLEALSPQGEVRYCTLADNTGDGIHIINPTRALTIANTIIAANLGMGLSRQETPLFPDAIQVQESDVWGNVKGDWSLPGLDSAKVKSLTGASLDVNPRFVDPVSLAYWPRAGSKLANYETQPLPIVIGYRP